MSKLLYQIGNFFYILAIHIASLWNSKAKQWVNGRKDWKNSLQKFTNNNKKPIIWMHCASLGEFEQGRPVIESIKNTMPNYNIVVSFFSPSGYEVQKNYDGAAYICYLPVNNNLNAQFFLEKLKPVLVLWVKYDFWDAYLMNLAKRRIPTLLISSKFRKEQPFFRFYGKYWQNLLLCFSHLFVQDNESKDLLQTININHTTVAGDTRFDRVLAIAKESYSNKIVEHFIGEHICLVAGSTWTEDDEELCHFANKHLNLKIIIAPHHINEERLQEMEKLYHQTIRYSAYKENNNANVLIIDNIGMLSFLYRYAKICIVGGGFGGDGVHNTLEAAVYGKPILFGPAYEKYQEAVDLIDLYVAFDVDNALEMESIIMDLLNDETYYQEKVIAAKQYVLDNVGSSNKVMHYVLANRLLTKS